MSPRSDQSINLNYLGRNSFTWCNASNPVFAAFAPANASIGYMKEGVKDSADFECISDLVSTTIDHIDSREEGISAYPIGTWKTKSSDWIADDQNGSRHTNWRLAALRINRLEIRYKDVECETADWHKVGIGGVYFAETDEDWGKRNTRITKIVQVEDVSHPRY